MTEKEFKYIFVRTFNTIWDENLTSVKSIDDEWNYLINEEGKREIRRRLCKMAFEKDYFLLRNRRPRNLSRGLNVKKKKLPKNDDKI